MFEDVYPENILARQLTFFRRVVADAQPSYSYGSLPVQDRQSVRYHRLVLPLATDGYKVDMLIGVMAFDDITINALKND